MQLCRTHGFGYSRYFICPGWRRILWDVDGVWGSAGQTESAIRKEMMSPFLSAVPKSCYSSISFCHITILEGGSTAAQFTLMESSAGWSNDRSPAAFAIGGRERCDGGMQCEIGINEERSSSISPQSAISGSSLRLMPTRRSEAMTQWQSRVK